MIGALGPDLAGAGPDRFGIDVPYLRHHLDKPAEGLARGERHGIADHVGLAAWRRHARLPAQRAVSLSPMVDVLRAHAHLLRGDLRQHGEDAFADLGDAGDDLRRAAVVDLGPGAGAIDRRGAGDPVPAAGHAASAFAGHAPTPPLPACPSAIRGNRAPSVQAARTPSPPRSRARVAARDRRAGFPAGGRLRRHRARA